MKHTSLLFLLFTLLLSDMVGQSFHATVQGRVADESGQPVIYASTVLFQTADSAMIKASFTDESGNFQISPVNPGSYYLQIMLVGYETETIEHITITGSENIALDDVTLKTTDTQLQEVVVTTTRPLVEVKPDKTVFNVEGSINATGNTALELLRKAPGVVVDNNERIMLMGKSGVKVYIDGRQSVLQGEDLSNYLKTLQSSQIESIEIITQPSSRYEADGNAGIINIRLIKDKSLGTNAIVSLSHNQAEHGRSNINTNVNMRNPKWNVFGNINYASGANSNWNTFERTTSQIYSYQENNGLNHWNNLSWRAGADYSSGKYSTIGVLFDGYHNNEPYDNTIYSILAPTPDAPISDKLVGTNSIDNLRDNFYLNGNYKFDNRSGTVLNVDLDYGTFVNTSDSYQPNYYYDPETGELTDENIYANDTRTDIDIKTVKTDYEHSLWKGVVSAGFKVADVQTTNDFEFYDIIDDVPVLNPDQTNQFDYSESVYAGYAQYNRQWEKIGFQLGLRAEQTDAEGVLSSETPENGQTVKQDYLDFFPSAGMSYQLHPKHALNLSFSRRIDRPGYQDLNPFEFKLDELTYRKGNPFLRPQYTNNVQLSHTFNHTLNTSVSFSHTTDLIAPLVDTASNGAAYMTNANIADQFLYNLNVSYPFSITKAWNVFVNSGVYYKENKSDFEEGKFIDVNATTFNFYAQNTLSLPAGFTFELSGWYNSPSIWGGNFQSESIWSMDAGVQKKWWDDRATLKISVSDLFKTNSWKSSSVFGDLQMKASGGWESRQLRLNFTYTLGNTSVKESRERKTGLQEEASRIK